MWRQGSRLPLSIILLRDAILFFVLYLCVSLANMIYYAATDDHQNRAFLAPMVAAMTSVSACRVIFNLRGIGQHAPASLPTVTCSACAGQTQKQRQHDTDTSFSPSKRVVGFSFGRISGHSQSTNPSLRAGPNEGAPIALCAIGKPERPHDVVDLSGGTIRDWRNICGDKSSDP